jgi:hypothetical protein
MGKLSGSAHGAGETEAWLVNRAIMYKCPRTDRDVVPLVEFAAKSDPRRKMSLGLLHRTRRQAGSEGGRMNVRATRREDEC